jgi:hypothetical protein
MAIIAKGVINLNEPGRGAQRSKISNLIQTLFWIVTRSDEDKLSILVAYQEDVRSKPGFFRVTQGYNYNGLIYLAGNFSHHLEYAMEFDADFERIAVDIAALSLNVNTGYQWVDVFNPYFNKPIADWIIENSETSKMLLSRPMVFKATQDGKLCFTEEAALQYVRLNTDYARFTQMVLNRYSKLTQAQVELIGSITYAHSEFVKTNQHKALRELFDDFFKRGTEHLPTYLVGYHKRVDVITRGEWAGELMGDHHLPEDIKSIHYKCEYTNGGQNWNAQAGLQVQIQVQHDDRSYFDYMIFIDEKSEVVYSHGMYYHYGIIGPFNVRQAVFREVCRNHPPRPAGTS